MKLSAKFARQETEAARLARIARRRISKEREAAVRRMLSLPDDSPTLDDPPPAGGPRREIA